MGKLKICKNIYNDICFFQENSNNLDKHDRNYDRGFYCSQQPRRASASVVDEFFEDSNNNFPAFPPFSKPSQPLMNHNTSMPIGQSYHLNPSSFNISSNSCVKKPCPPTTLINQPVEEVYSSSVQPAIMNFVDISESSDLPGLFDSITPPHHSPAACIKTEKIQPPDTCSFPPGSPEFASLLDVSMPEQVIVKREPNVDNGGMQHYPLMSVPQVSQISHNTYLGHYTMSRLMMPLTPPSSEPGSDSVDSVNVRTTPPPPYVSTSPSNLLSALLDTNEDQDVKSAAYNRRNNPELERRRTHRCMYPGEFIN